MSPILPQPMIPILISLAVTEYLLAALRLPLPCHVAGEECRLEILGEELTARAAEQRFEGRVPVLRQ